QHLASTAHEHTPLVDIHAQTTVPPTQPLFHSILVFENYPTSATAITKLDVRVRWEWERVNYPLALIVERQEPLSFTIGYDRSRFDDATVERLLGHLETVLEAIVADPDQTLGE